MRLTLLLVAPGVLLAQQPAPVPAPANCAVDGYVVNALTGEPVPRALVQFAGQAAAGTVADGAGRWSLKNISCGRVIVIATKPGFLNSQLRGAITGTAPVSTVSPDSPLHDFRVELIPQAVITGRVTDESGDPIQNAQMTVMMSRIVEGRRSFQPMNGVNTNDLGEFRIPGLAASRVIVCARAANDMLPPALGNNMIFGEKCYPGPVEGGSASTMNIAAGRETRVDLTLTRVPSTSIHGKVTGVPEGHGVMVSLQPRSIGRPGSMITRQSGLAKDGTFDIRGVAPGAWVLAVDYWEAGSRLFARVPVDVNGSDIDGVVVHVESGFSVTGAVRVQSTSGKALNPQQVNLNLRGVDAVSAAGGVQWDKNRTGFTISEVTPGNYLLNVSLPAPFYVKSAMLGGRDIYREMIPISQSAGPIDVQIADDAGSVRGRLEDSNGDAAAGWVMVWREGRPPTAQPTGPDGTFKVNGLPPGEYRVYGWDDYQQVEWGDADWMRRNGGAGVAVTVADGQSADIKVPRVVTPKD